ncbi:MAG TPA: hypothetical protein VKU80_13535, partial [Planctomycetota bacterium]|nr:hypothetical protein [Planctomycetota bacterium]
MRENAAILSSSAAQKKPVSGATGVPFHPPGRGSARGILGIARALVLALLAGLASVPRESRDLVAQDEKPVPIERRVALDLHSESWREEGAYAIGKELKKKLAKAGVGVVEGPSKKADGPSRKADGVLEVRYSEAKGKEYKVLGGTSSLGFGSEIELQLTLRDPQSRELLSLRVEGAPSEIITKSPFEASLEALQYHELYKDLESFVAAALGIRSAFPTVLACLSWPEAHEIAEKILKDSGYKPANRQEEAYWAVGHEDWAACVKLGEVAAEPLIELFERQTQAPGGLDDKLFQALLSIGGPKVKDAFLSELTSKQGQKEVYRSELLAVLPALGKLGETRAIPSLESLSEDDDADLAKEAKKTLRLLRLIPQAPAPARASAPGEDA